MKARNSSLVKEEPLSVRTFCGRLTPCNFFGGRDRLHHVDVEPFGVGVHDDQKNVKGPMKGPVKSSCSLLHGSEGHSQE